MKKFIPIVASVLLLAACGGNPETSKATGVSTTEESRATGLTTVESTAETATLTFLEPGEIYIDLNFEKAPEGLAVKIGSDTLTASGKVKMSKDFTYSVEGTFADKVNVYHVVDLGAGVVSAGKSEGRDGATATEFLGRLFKNFSERQYEYRIYLCLSDKASGWSKTLDGVDAAIQRYAM